MFKLWVFSSEYQPYIVGGLGTVATHLTRELSVQGFKITVISVSPNKHLSLDKQGNVTILRFPGHYTYKQIYNHLINKKLGIPHMFHIHSLQYVPLVRHYNRKWNIPIVYTCHSLVTKKSSSKVFTPSRQAQLLRSAQKIVVPSRSEYEHLLSKYAFCKAKTRIIKHGVVLRPGISHASKYRLLYVGRLVHDKGIEQLLDATAILKRKKPKVRLYLIGKGPAGFTKVLKNRSRKLQITSNVRWLGYYNQTKLQAAYKQYGSLIMPSRQESFGLVALEALANGIPLVSTQAGGLRQFVTSHVAQVIPNVQGKSIADAIVKMWNSNSVTKKRVLKGKKKAMTYRWSSVAKKYKQIFNALRR